MLSHAEARAFYDRLGSRQDLQRFYENPAMEALIAHSAFGRASAVVELGCGTGRLAERLLRNQLPGAATYAGFDVSGRMVKLARERLEPWPARARVEQTGGAPTLPLPDRSCDRFVSTYVLDLLSEDDIRAVLGEVRRLLVPGGLLCLVSLTFGETILSRAVCRLWSRVHAYRPALVGGCRPLRLADLVGNAWRVQHDEVVCTFGICSEVLVAS